MKNDFWTSGKAMTKASKLNDELVKINPARNGSAYAIGFRFDNFKNYVVTYNKGTKSRAIEKISAELFEVMGVQYLAHMVFHAVAMGY